MTLGTGIVLSGFGYACACRLSTDVSSTGIKRGRIMALFCLVVGISVDVFMSVSLLTN